MALNISNNALRLLSIIVLLFHAKQTIATVVNDDFVDDDTLVPTLSPTANPTKAPTANPTKAPTLAPTANPTKAPTQSPTKAPTQNPTKAPTQNPVEEPISGGAIDGSCTVSDDGLYGDETASSNQQQFVTYEYSMAYKSTADAVNIVEGLEKSMTNSVIDSTSLFAECSSSTRSLIRNGKTSSNRMLENTVVALSSMPNDSFSDIECTPVSSDSNCVLVQGSMTLWYDEVITRRLQDTPAESEIRSLIKNRIEDGTFVATNEDIIGLQYIESSGNEDPNTVLGDDTKNGVSVSIIFIATAATLVVVGVAGLKLRQMRKEKPVEGKFTDLDDSSIGTGVPKVLTTDDIEDIEDDGSTAYDDVHRSYSENALHQQWMELK